MGYSYNFGLLTPTKGAAVSAVRVAIGGSGAVGAITQAKAGFIESVTRVSAGLYRFKLASNQSRPVRELVIIPSVASQTAAGSNRKAYFDNGTYNATTGEFDVQVTDLTAASPVASDPVSGDSLHVLIFVERYS